jgi:hypothetical protein
MYLGEITVFSTLSLLVYTQGIDAIDRFTLGTIMG